MRGTFRELANAGEIPEPHTPLIEPRLSSPLTPRWSKGDSNSWSHPERQRSEGATWVIREPKGTWAAFVAACAR